MPSASRRTLGAHRAQPDPVADDPGAGELGDQPGGPVQDRRSAVSGDGRPAPVAVVVGAADHDRVRDAARRTSDRSRPATSGPGRPRRRAPPARAPGATSGSPAEQPRAEPGAVHDDVVGGCGRRAEADPGQRAAELLEPGAQPPQVDRHVDDRGGERPRVGVPRGRSDARRGPGPRRPTTGRRSGAGSTSVPGSIRTPVSSLARQLGEDAVGRRRPGGDPVLGQRPGRGTRAPPRPPRSSPAAGRGPARRPGDRPRRA